MRKLVILSIILFTFVSVDAQLFKYGIRGGINSSQLKLTDMVEVKAADGTVTSTMYFKPTKAFGFHFGAFSQIAVAGFFFQPELLFVTSGDKVEVEVDGKKQTANQRDWRFDIPLMVGWKFGPARLGIGPVASFNLHKKDELNDIINETTKTESTNFTTNKAVWGLQVGGGLNVLGKLAFDIKWQYGLTKFGESVTIGNNKYDFSQDRKNQLIISVGYFF